jgi:hypothetical protein
MSKFKYNLTLSEYIKLSKGNASKKDIRLIVRRINGLPSEYIENKYMAMINQIKPEILSDLSLDHDFGDIVSRSIVVDNIEYKYYESPVGKFLLYINNDSESIASNLEAKAQMTSSALGEEMIVVIFSLSGGLEFYVAHPARVVIDKSVFSLISNEINNINHARDKVSIDGGGVAERYIQIHNQIKELQFEMNRLKDEMIEIANGRDCNIGDVISITQVDGRKSIDYKSIVSDAGVDYNESEYIKSSKPSVRINIIGGTHE